MTGSNGMIATSSITVGRRHRKDLGDIASLAKEIEAVGLLHPIVVTPAGKLIAGERRIEAFKRLGRVEIPATVVDIREIARAEASENFTRKDFTLSEAVAIKRALEPEIRSAARQRQAMAGGSAPGKLPEAVEQSKGDTRDKVAAFTGYAARTMDKAEEIVRAAAAEPARFGKLLEDMDRTGRVNGLYKRLKVARQAEAIRKEPPPLPGNGPYRVIVADPPWPYEMRLEDPSHRATTPYPQMSIDQICAVHVGPIAHADCIVWLWTTNFHMRAAFSVLDAWGFAPRTILTWVKDRMGTGDWLRGQSEHCLLAMRGKPIVHLTNQTTVLHAPARAHSQKPDEFYAVVESLCPAPRYATLFHRGATRPNWDGHGDEADDATRLTPEEMTADSIASYDAALAALREQRP